LDQREEVTGGWRKLHNEELHSLYSSPSVIIMMNSMRMGLAGHVARTGGGMHIGYWRESQEERHHWEDHGAGGWIILRWI
jgi:hypothetical protein